MEYSALQSGGRQGPPSILVAPSSRSARPRKRKQDTESRTESSSQTCSLPRVPRRSRAGSSPLDSGGWRSRPAKPRGPIPPATSSAAADSPGRHGSARLWAAAKPIRVFARLACKYGCRLPKWPPVPQDPPASPIQDSTASPSVLFFAEIVLKPQDRALHRLRTGERRLSPHRSRGSAPIPSADSRLREDMSTTQPEGALLTRPCARISLQVA